MLLSCWRILLRLFLCCVVECVRMLRRDGTMREKRFGDIIRFYCILSNPRLEEVIHGEDMRFLTCQNCMSICHTPCWVTTGGAPAWVSTGWVPTNQYHQCSVRPTVQALGERTYWRKAPRRDFAEPLSGLESEKKGRRSSPQFGRKSED